MLRSPTRSHSAGLLLSLLAAAFTTLTGVATVAPATASPPIRIKDLEYIRRTYFFIADHQIEWDRGSLSVWRDDGSGYNNIGNTFPGRARLNPMSPEHAVANPEYLGQFDPLTQGADYGLIFPYYLPTPNMEIPIIQLATPLAQNEVLGVSYLERIDGEWVMVGNPNPMESDSVLGKEQGEVLLRMIHPSMGTITTVPGGTFDRSSPWYPSLSYQLRNFYRLGEFSPADLRLTVRRLDAAFSTDPDAFQGVPFIEILGLDQEGPVVGSPPDGQVDLRYIDWENGILHFPDLHPFRPDTVGAGCPPGMAGFLCLDDISRNTLRVCDQFDCIANPNVYDMKLPDYVNQARFYLEVSLRAPEAPHALRQNRPNPFRSATTIEFVSDASFVRLSVHDIQGRLVKVLMSGTLPEGPQTVTWNGTDTAGRRVSSGIYVCRLEGTGFQTSRRMVLIH